MQPGERKRQGYIHELIRTEERYVDDLQLVVEVRAVPAGAAGLRPRHVSPLMCDLTRSGSSSPALTALSVPTAGRLKDSGHLLAPGAENRRCLCWL